MKNKKAIGARWSSNIGPTTASNIGPGFSILRPQSTHAGSDTQSGSSVCYEQGIVVLSIHSFPSRSPGMSTSIMISPIGFWKLARVCRRNTLSGGFYPLKTDRSRWIHSKSAKAEKLGRDRPSTTGRTWDTRHPCRRGASTWRHFVKYLQRPSHSATQDLPGRSDRRNRALPCSLFVRGSLLQPYHSSRVYSIRVEHCHVRGGAPTRLSG